MNPSYNAARTIKVVPNAMGMKPRCFKDREKAYECAQEIADTTLDIVTVYHPYVHSEVYPQAWRWLRDQALPQAGKIAEMAEKGQVPVILPREELDAQLQSISRELLALREEIACVEVVSKLEAIESRLWEVVETIQEIPGSTPSVS